MKDIIAMARECGLPSDELYHPNLERFAALVAAAERDKWMERTAILIRGEREACAQLCEGWEFVPGGHEFTPQQLTQNITSTIARHIRARGGADAQAQ